MTAPIGPSGMRKKSGPPRRCCGRRRLGNCMQCAARVHWHRTAATANGGAGKAETGNTPAPPATPHPQTAARRAVRKVAAVVVRKGGLANREPVIAALLGEVLPFTGLWSLDGAEWPPTRALGALGRRCSSKCSKSTTPPPSTPPHYPHYPPSPTAYPHCSAHNVLSN